MSADNTLIIVHGMGVHSRESFTKEVKDAFKKIFALYPTLKNQSIDDYCNIVAVGYDDLFNTARENIKNSTSLLDEKLSTIGVTGDFGDFLQELISIDNDFDSDDVFYTHWLDVLLYRFTLLGDAVRVRVGKEIVDTMKTEGSIHVLGHSLGTSILHDTLACLFTDRGIKEEDGTVHKLDIVEHGLKSLHMVANTSNVLESIVDIEDSIVKPGPGGCVSYYGEYRHKLDPITWVRPFNPTNNNGWISSDSWYRYKLAEISEVTNKHGDTHSIEHYLMNPEVHQYIFETTLDIYLSENEKKKVRTIYDDMTLQTVAKNLSDTLKKLRVNELNSIKALINTGKESYKFVKNLKEQYNA